MKKKYLHGSHTTHRNMYHIVWLPKYRKKILKGEIKARIEEILRECAEINNWQIQALNIQVDHVHLVIQIPPSISVSSAIQKLKGISSRLIRKELPQEIKKFLWGIDFWADGFFCESIGSCSEETILNY